MFHALPCSVISSVRVLSRGRGRLVAAAAAFALTLAGASGAARAEDEDTPEIPSFSARRRTAGFGTAFGGGFSAAKANSTYGQTLFSPMWLGPTMEMQFFFPEEYSIDLSVPITNIVVGSAAVKGFYFNMDMFFNANAGKGKTRFIVGPGIGFSHLSAGYDSANSLRIPAQLGFEVLSKSRGFGFKMLARPFVEFAFGTRADAVGGGLLGAIVFSGYATRDAGYSSASR